MIKLIVRELAAAAGIGNALVLSRQSGLAYAMCHKLWNDQQTRIDLTTIDRLCEVFGCSPGDLIVREAPAPVRIAGAVRTADRPAPAEAATGSSVPVTSSQCRRIRWID